MHAAREEAPARPSPHRVTGRTAAASSTSAPGCASPSERSSSRGLRPRGRGRRPRSRGAEAPVVGTPRPSTRRRSVTARPSGPEVRSARNSARRRPGRRRSGGRPARRATGPRRGLERGASSESTCVSRTGRRLRHARPAKAEDDGRVAGLTMGCAECSRTSCHDAAATIPLTTAGFPQPPRGRENASRRGSVVPRPPHRGGSAGRGREGAVGGDRHAGDRPRPKADDREREGRGRPPPPPRACTIPSDGEAEAAFPRAGRASGPLDFARPRAGIRATGTAGRRARRRVDREGRAKASPMSGLQASPRRGDRARPGARERTRPPPRARSCASTTGALVRARSRTEHLVVGTRPPGEARPVIETAAVGTESRVHSLVHAGRCPCAAVGRGLRPSHFFQRRRPGTSEGRVVPVVCRSTRRSGPLRHELHAEGSALLDRLARLRVLAEEDARQHRDAVIDSDLSAGHVDELRRRPGPCRAAGSPRDPRRRAPCRPRS